MHVAGESVLFTCVNAGSVRAAFEFYWAHRTCHFERPGELELARRSHA